MTVTWMVILKIETDSPEIFTFEEHQEQDAKDTFTRFQRDWSDVYLCEVKQGPEV